MCPHELVLPRLRHCRTEEGEGRPHGRVPRQGSPFLFFLLLSLFQYFGDFGSFVIGEVRLVPARDGEARRLRAQEEHVLWSLCLLPVLRAQGTFRSIYSMLLYFIICHVDVGEGAARP